MVKLLSTLILMEELNNNYFILFIILTGPTAFIHSKAIIHSYALIDNRGSVISFMDINFAILY